MTPGQMIRKAREALGWRVERLAVEVDVSRDTITQIELDHRLPRWELMVRIAQALDLSLDELASAKPPPAAKETRSHFRQSQTKAKAKRRRAGGNRPLPEPAPSLHKHAAGF